jgi:hypothetical protein
MTRMLKGSTIALTAAAVIGTAFYARRQLEEAAAAYATASPYGVPGPVTTQPQAAPTPVVGPVRWLLKPVEEDDSDDDPIRIPIESVNPREFVRPFDKPFLTPEERKRLMEEPGVKFVRRGPKGSPFYEMGEYVWPFDDDQFVVRIDLVGAALEEKELAEEVRRRLKFARPQNPGRRESFPRWSTTSKPLPGPAPPRTSSASGPFRGPIPLVHSGWRLTIRRVDGRPDDWRALVHVAPVLRTENYGQVANVRDFHVEVYRWEDGALRLDRDFPDPDRTSDPDAGIECVVLE